MITIIDCGVGNLSSIENMLKFCGIKVEITHDVDKIKNAQKLILSGVGHFAYSICQLNTLGICDIIKEHALIKQKPILGICLGMQLMTNFSEEGEVPGLGLIDAKTKKFHLQDQSLKIPHVGWNEVLWHNKSQILHGFCEKPRYYFVHSYFVECNQKNDILGTTHYGQDFVAAFQHDNIIGVQFHPEKSHQFGMEFLKNFAKL